MLEGLTLTPVTIVGVTPRLPCPLILSIVAVICTVPAALAVAVPVVPAALLICATDELETDQCAEAVTSCDVPSLNDAIAVKACV